MPPTCRNGASDCYDEPDGPGLLPRILDLNRADAPRPGDRPSERRFADRLQVSRTPVRAALGHLAQHGVVQRAARGFVMGAADAADRFREALAAAPDETAHLTQRLAADRQAGTLPGEVSESDPMRRYHAGRGTVQRALARLAALGAVERKAGHGWAFRPTLDGPAARHDAATLGTGHGVATFGLHYAKVENIFRALGSRSLRVLDGMAGL